MAANCIDLRPGRVPTLWKRRLGALVGLSSKLIRVKGPARQAAACDDFRAITDERREIRAMGILEERLYDYMIDRDVPPLVAQSAAEECARRMERNAVLGAAGGLAIGYLTAN